MVNYYGEELLYLILHDITDRIEAEYKLKHSRERYRNLLESISDRIYVLDHDLRLVVINEAVAKFVNKSRQDIIGKRITDVFPDIKSYPVYDAVIKVLNTSEPIVIEENLTCRDGKNNWYNINIYPVPEGALCITSDITIQKINENSLRIMNEKLKKSNQELEQFAYIASHDLQEPIRMISNFSEILKQDYYEKLEEEGREYIDTIIDGSERMSEIVADLLEYSRIEKKNQPFDFIDLNDVLNKAIKNLAGFIKNNKAQIIHDKLPTIYADKVQMILVFQNLLSNAIKFVKDKTPVIHVSSNSVKNKWVIFVRDNGIGISKAYHNKIFEMFKRLHTKDEFPGTGIGLTSCKKVIDRHNGDIWLESELGKGSTFYFSIPHKINQIQ
jgi:PAS domain S-box-containing protein